MSRVVSLLFYVFVYVLMFYHGGMKLFSYLCVLIAQRWSAFPTQASAIIPNI